MTNHVAPRPCTANGNEVRLLEVRQKPAEPIARGVGIDRVGFENRRAMCLRVLLRRLQEGAERPLTTNGPLNEEAHERPNVLVLVSRLEVGEARSVRGARRD